MLRIINFRVDVKNKNPLEALLVHKFPVLKDQIQEIHVVRRAVDARKKTAYYLRVYLVRSGAERSGGYEKAWP